MRKRHVFLILLGLVIAGGIAIILSRPEREPEYGGKPLSQWVERWATPPYSGTQVDQSTDAVLHNGTNAVPYLLKWIRYEPPPWKDKMY